MRILIGMGLLLLGGVFGISGACYGSNGENTLATLCITIMLLGFAGSIRELRAFVREDNIKREKL